MKLTDTSLKESAKIFYSVLSANKVSIRSMQARECFANSFGQNKDFGNLVAMVRADKGMVASPSIELAGSWLKEKGIEVDNNTLKAALSTAELFGILAKPMFQSINIKNTSDPFDIPVQPDAPDETLVWIKAYSVEPEFSKGDSVLFCDPNSNEFSVGEIMRVTFNKEKAIKFNACYWVYSDTVKASIPIQIDEIESFNDCPIQVLASNQLN